jgi:hypothetical protein
MNEFTKTSISVHIQIIAVQCKKNTGTHTDNVHLLQVYHVFLLHLITELYQLSNTVQDSFEYSKLHNLTIMMITTMANPSQRSGPAQGTHDFPVTLLIDLTSGSGFTNVW